MESGPYGTGVGEGRRKLLLKFEGDGRMWSLTFCKSSLNKRDGSDCYLKLHRASSVSLCKGVYALRFSDLLCEVGRTKVLEIMQFVLSPFSLCRVLSRIFHFSIKFFKSITILFICLYRQLLPSIDTVKLHHFKQRQKRGDIMDVLSRIITPSGSCRAGNL